MPGPHQPHSDPNNHCPIIPRKPGHASMPRLQRRGSAKGGRLYPNVIGALHHMRDGRHYRVVACSPNPAVRRGMFRRCDAEGTPIPRLRLSKKLRRLMRAELFHTPEAPARPVRGRGMARAIHAEAEPES